MRKTKIICTVGPACDNEETLAALCRHGMDVARLNFSHGDHKGHGEAIARIKSVRERLGLPIAIMLDTKGPEYRIGTFAGGKVQVEDGAPFTFTAREVSGDGTVVTVSHKTLAKDLSVRMNPQGGGSLDVNGPGLVRGDTRKQVMLPEKGRRQC